MLHGFPLPYKCLTFELRLFRDGYSEGERDFVPYQSWGLIRESSTQKETELTSLKPKFSGRIIMKRDFMASRLSGVVISSMLQVAWLTVEPIFHKRWLEVSLKTTVPFRNKPLGSNTFLKSLWYLLIRTTAFQNNVSFLHNLFKGRILPPTG
jgi:hypothetical protein